MPGTGKVQFYAYGQPASVSETTERMDDGTGFMIGVVGFMCAVLIAWIFVRKWSALAFGKYGRFTQNRHIQVYLYLSSEMIRRDIIDVQDKTKYVHSYILKHFPDSKNNFEESLRYALKNPIDPRKIAVWMRTHLKEGDRMQIMYFLAGIAFIDGSVNKREMNLLRFLQSQLEISPKGFDQVIAMHTQKQRRSRQQQKQTKQKVYRQEKSARQIAFEILGVSEHASWEEIKKAYRNLVKETHPDRFASDTKEQQAIAQKRFIEVQKAYEFIETTY